MMKKIIFTFLIFFVLVGQSVCYAIDGKTLLESCAVAIQKMDGKSKVSGVRVGYCHGYVQGLIDMNTFYNGYVQNLMEINTLYNGSGIIPLFCLPQTISNGEGARIVFDYLRSNPERLREYGGVLAIEAFMEAFPCE
jgi:hypothetical protein